MAAEFLAGLSAVKTAFDIAKGLKEINDTATRNAAVIELQEHILTAQQAQAALVDCIRDLEKEVAGFEAWKAEKQRYKLVDYGGGTFAYELKPEAADGEPGHRICAACYQKGHKSILQFDFRTQNSQDRYECPGCQATFDLGTTQSRPMPRITNRWSP